MSQPTISFDDFSRVEMRVGRVVSATLPEWSNKLVELVVSFGPEMGEKTILTGVRQWFSPADFEGNSYIFVVNLAERKMGEGVSQGMMLMAEGLDKPVPLGVTEPAPEGALIR